jgi:hypothetical protein
MAAAEAGCAVSVVGIARQLEIRPNIPQALLSSDKQIPNSMNKRCRSVFKKVHPYDIPTAILPIIMALRGRLI